MNQTPEEIEATIKKLDEFLITKKEIDKEIVEVAYLVKIGKMKRAKAKFMADANIKFFASSESDHTEYNKHLEKLSKLEIKSMNINYKIIECVLQSGLDEAIFKVIMS